MTLLDQHGRDVDTLWKAKALASWLHEPKLNGAMVRAYTKEFVFSIGLALAAYLGSGGPEYLLASEAIVERASVVAVSNRTVRRLIASHLVKEKGLQRGEAMKALKRMGE